MVEMTEQNAQQGAEQTPAEAIGEPTPPSIEQQQQAGEVEQQATPIVPEAPTSEPPASGPHPAAGQQLPESAGDQGSDVGPTDEATSDEQAAAGDVTQPQPYGVTGKFIVQDDDAQAGADDQGDDDNAGAQ